MSAIDEGIVREYFEQNGFLVRQARKYQVQSRRKVAEEEIDLMVYNPAWQREARRADFFLFSSELPYVHKAIVDSAMLNTRPGSDFNLSMCGLWGNRNLAFVNAAVVFEEQQRIGWQSVLVMMARRGDSWTLLNIGGNVDVITELDDSIDLVDDGLARPFDNSVLRVLAPADGVSSPRDAKPQLEWQWRGGPAWSKGQFGKPAGTIR